MHVQPDVSSIEFSGTYTQVKDFLCNPLYMLDWASVLFKQMGHISQQICTENLIQIEHLNLVCTDVSAQSFYLYMACPDPCPDLFNQQQKPGEGKWRGLQGQH